MQAKGGGKGKAGGKGYGKVGVERQNSDESADKEALRSILEDEAAKLEQEEHLTNPSRGYVKGLTQEQAKKKCMNKKMQKLRDRQRTYRQNQKGQRKRSKIQKKTISKVIYETQTLEQDLLELAAIKSNLPQFKEGVASYAEKRTNIMLALNKLARQIGLTNDTAYKLTEQQIKSLEQYDQRVRAICNNIQREKGPDCRVVQFFDDQIKKFEFRLGITSGILEVSLVREIQREQELKEFQHKQPNIDKTIDTLDLGMQQQLAHQSADLNEFGQVVDEGGLDQNQTMGLGGQGGVTKQSDRIEPKEISSINDTTNQNDTIAIVDNDEGNYCDLSPENFQSPIYTLNQCQALLDEAQTPASPIYGYKEPISNSSPAYAQLSTSPPAYAGLDFEINYNQ